MGLGWFPSISSSLNSCAGQLCLPLVTAAESSRMRVDLYLSGVKSNPECVANVSVPERHVLTYTRPHTVFLSGTVIASTCGELNSCGLPPPPTLDSFAFSLTASLSCVLWPFWSLASAILWLRGVVIAWAVFLLAVPVTPALLCLAQFPSDQVVPITGSCCPRMALPHAHKCPSGPSRVSGCVSC